MLNFAIIGTNWITAAFVTSAHATSKWQLSAVYSRKEETARDFAAKFTANAAIYTSLEALAADQSIDVVYVASPNSLHFAQAKQLLEARKHVVLEKPATSTSAELDILFRTARAHDVFLLEAFRHLHEVNFKILRDALPRLGPLYGASLNYAAYSSRYDNVLRGETPNIFSLDFSGGSLVDLGVYPISAAVALFGPPKAQQYFPVMIRTGADGGGVVLLQYDGFAVSMNASKIYTSTAPSEIYGEKGTLVIPSITDITSVKFLDAQKKGKSEELGKEKESLNLKEEADDFARIIEEKDWKMAEKLEKLSRAVLTVTENLRRANGLKFTVEKEA
ncbi:oxidoreductase-like protein [Glonium stellatum]|uniref:Oxidoreductase-like protein n=1 Tax=Glonium stellatum TaxID=574774 RepID=A0A8E2JRF8_9PEZI|nr:oxidoreductase-like protein [Glonium stellatum]